MKNRSFSAALTGFAAALSVLETVSCTYGASCPSGSVSDGSGDCVSVYTDDPLEPVPTSGLASSSFYYLGEDTGYVMGKGTQFSSTSLSTSTFTADVSTSFGGGPPLTAGMITEAFTAVAVYTPLAALEAELEYGVMPIDTLTGTISDLTGYIVAVGYALTTSGSVVSLVARFSPRGTLDTTFNGTGYVLGPPSGFTGGSFTMLRAVAVDTFGNIVVGGFGNVQPSIFSYLSQNISANGDPYSLYSSGSNDEFQAVVARYTPLGGLDTTFDASQLVVHPSGSATAGYAVSPSTGYAGTETAGDRLEYVTGLKVDASGGIFAVGGAFNSYQNHDYELPFILHFSSQGELLSYLVGTQNTGRPLAAPDTSDTFYDSALNPPNASVNNYYEEVYTGITTDGTDGVINVDSDLGTVNSIIVAGNSGRYGDTFSALTARFTLQNYGTRDTTSGLSTETIVADSTFNASGTPGYLLNSGPFDSIDAWADWITGVTYDSAGNIVLSGQSSLSVGPSQTLIAAIPASGTGTSVYQIGNPTAPSGYSTTGYCGGTNDLFGGAAVLVSSDGTETRYFGAGISNCGTLTVALSGTTSVTLNTSRSVLASYVSSGSSLSAADSTTFEQNPYYVDPSLDITVTIPFPLPPFLYDTTTETLAPSPYALPPGIANVQLGPTTVTPNLTCAAGASCQASYSPVYGGGVAEQLNAVIPSLNGQYAIAVGYTTDLLVTTTTAPSGAAPLTGRSFPILLFYNMDGTFVNLGGFSTFETLQQAL